MASRVLRHYDHDGTRILRVTFRDDDNQPMRVVKTSEALMRSTLRERMIKGIVVAGRHFGYLGNSNSQMRDGGAYFMEKYSRRSFLEYINEHKKAPDVTWQPKIVSVRRDLGDESYTFSDGVGMISKAFAKQIAEDMMLKDCLPSCFQFRFRGLKGVMAVNPMLDEIALWASENGIRHKPDMFDCCSWLVKMVFRRSQIK
ncbi:unnamed protein product [Strongylus vulgaris]|uniref:RNA-dependent RNA polymerase n=1 Tax=Strongylus vulgaris TaxID=40348 RepID=A0A3P7LRL7_STRVU|nr:unnamed protein product [Strongylus vulgaris]